MVTARRDHVLQSMRTFEFDVMGATRTYLDFYLGFGMYITVLLLLQAVLVWQLASLASVDPRRARPLVATLSLGTLIGTFVVWRFILAVPALFSLACGICLTIGTLSFPRGESGQGHEQDAYRRLVR